MTDTKDIPNPFEQKDKQLELVREKMASIKHKIVIINGKGGVGKSLVTVNLAVLYKYERDGVNCLHLSVERVYW